MVRGIPHVRLNNQGIGRSFQNKPQQLLGLMVTISVIDPMEVSPLPASIRQKEIN